MGFEQPSFVGEQAVFSKAVSPPAVEPHREAYARDQCQQESETEEHHVLAGRSRARLSAGDEGGLETHARCLQLTFRLHYIRMLLAVDGGLPCQLAGPPLSTAFPMPCIVLPRTNVLESKRVSPPPSWETRRQTIGNQVGALIAHDLQPPRHVSCSPLHSIALLCATGPTGCVPAMMPPPRSVS